MYVVLKVQNGNGNHLVIVFLFAETILLCYHVYIKNIRLGRKGI